MVRHYLRTSWQLSWGVHDRMWIVCALLIGTNKQWKSAKLWSFFFACNSWKPGNWVCRVSYSLHQVKIESAKKENEWNCTKIMFHSDFVSILCSAKFSLSRNFVALGQCKRRWCVCFFHLISFHLKNLTERENVSERLFKHHQTYMSGSHGTATCVFIYCSVCGCKQKKHKGRQQIFHHFLPAAAVVCSGGVRKRCWTREKSSELENLILLLRSFYNEASSGVFFLAAEHIIRSSLMYVACFLSVFYATCRKEREFTAAEKSPSIIGPSGEKINLRQAAEAARQTFDFDRPTWIDE